MLKFEITFKLKWKNLSFLKDFAISINITKLKGERFIRSLGVQKIELKIINFKINTGLM